MKNDSQSVVSSLKAPRMRGVSKSPELRFEQLLGLLAAVPAEVGLQQVDHRPEVPALLDVDLEEVPHVVEARRGDAEVALLLDAGRFGVALDDDQPAQVGAVLAGDLLPGRLALVGAEGDGPVGVALGEEDAPAVLLHRHAVEVRPAVTADLDGGAQVHVVRRDRRAEVLPPVEELRLPALERALQLAVATPGRRCSGCARCSRCARSGRSGLGRAPVSVPSGRVGLGPLGRGGSGARRQGGHVRPASCRSRRADPVP